MALINYNVDASDPAFAFLGLRPGEQVKVVVRHHWAGFVSYLLLALAMLAVPAILVFSLNHYFAGQLTIIHTYLLLILSAFFLFVLTFLFGAWIDYYYDILFITNQRIINVLQKGLLAREVAQLDITQVQDATTQVDGFWQTLFGYGLLIIETAGQGTADIPKIGMQGYFTIKNIPNPTEVAHQIMTYHQQQDAMTPNPTS